MVDPIWILIISLGIAFLLSLFDKISRSISLLIFFGGLAILTFIPSQWFIHILYGGVGKQIFTAGFQPPMSINLQMGLEESFFTFLINLAALLSAFYLLSKFKKTKSYAMSLFMALVLGLNGLVMTRDLFNTFVFLEISSIAIYSLISLERTSKTLAAGFKYIIAGGIASAFFLIGTIYIYRLTGTLNIDDLISMKSQLTGVEGHLAVFILLSAILIELKPFPANGWALDVYQAANPGFTALIASASSAAIFFVLYKLIPMLDVSLLPLLSVLGIITFIGSNLLGLKQVDSNRLLGYSSIGQMGLLMTALALILQIPNETVSSTMIIVVVGGLFLNHFFAKAGLFWLAGIVNSSKLEDWSVLKSESLKVIMFGSFLFALIGFPPFPGFWAKWQLIMQLAANDMMIWIVLILIGSLLEAVYLLRWFTKAIKSESNKNTSELQLSKNLPVAFFFLMLYFFGLISSNNVDDFSPLYLFPIMFAAIMYALDWLPAKMKAFLTMVMLGGIFYLLLPSLSGFKLIFAIIFLGGGIVQLIPTFRSIGIRKGFFPLLIMLLSSLGSLLSAETTLQFFISWEIMAISSYLLIMRGKFAAPHALKYILFSTFGSYMMLFGFGLAYRESGLILLESYAMLYSSIPAVVAFIFVGFLVKSGALGLHLWLPGAYAEAEDDVSPFISSILSKAGIFGFLLFLGILGKYFLVNSTLMEILGWIGALTAFFGALMAIFQEDIKYLLAYSSMSQIGYIVMTIATLSHLGWVAAIYMTFNHFMFKAILFITIAGVISRVKTRKMYEMGGLIKKMPLSFVAVLISIIAISGVPPLTGFGGKWLMYTSLFEKGWYLQAGLSFFAGAISFLYLFRLIHTIFLGQIKTKYQEVREASALYVIPSFIFVFAIMAFSMYPNYLLNPIINAVSSFFDTTVIWDGYTVISSLGYWNGNAVMMVTMGVFMLPLIWLLFRIRSIKKVKQFNIVFAAERPDKPETTHFSYNFFAHYQKAIGFLVTPVVTKFWNGVVESVYSIAAVIRNIYTGNGQTYALHILMYVVVIYLIIGIK
jgi:formate hydrogenlyase subunit 3/multisubunit Na+/H+ antiporter MnhD subunit